MKTALLFLLMASFAVPASANNLLDSLEAGAKTVGDAAKKGADAVGGVVKKGADAVGDAVSSTDELVRNEDTPEETRAKLDTMADAVVTQLLTENSEAAKAFDISAGYAAFDMRRLSVYPLSAGYGRGVAVSTPEGARTYMQMGTGGLGAAFGIGGFASQFVIIFETPADFERFITQGYDASLDAGTMEGSDKNSTGVKFTNGQSIFVLDKKGWRINANASGTKYWKDKALN